MRRKMVFAVLVCLCAFQFSFAQNFDWAFKSEIHPLISTGCNIVSDNSGNFLFGGAISIPYDFDPGLDTFNLINNNYLDLFIAKYSDNGSFIKAITLGGEAIDAAQNITVDNEENIIVTGQFTDSVDFDPGPASYFLYGPPYYRAAFILKLDSNLNFIWAKELHGINPTTYPFNNIESSTDGNGNIVVTGTFIGTVDFDPGPSSYFLSAFNTTFANAVSQFILKLDSAGNFVWAKAIKATRAIAPLSICTDQEKNIYTSGIFEDTVDFDPSSSIYSLSVHPQSHWWENDAFVSKYDSTGNLVWAKNFGSKKNENCASMELINNKNLLLAGSFQDTADFDPGPGVYFLQGDSNFYHEYDSYVLELDTMGNFIWAKQFKGISSGLTTGSRNDASDVSINSSGKIIVTGSFQGDSVDVDPGLATFYLNPTSTTSIEAYIVFLDNTGNFIYANKIGNSNSTVFLNSSCIASNGNYLFYGDFSDTIDFDFGANTFLMNSDSSCCSNKLILCLKESNTSLNENILLKDLMIFPNPATSTIHISLPTTSSQTIKTKIISVTGETVFAESTKSTQNNFSETIDVTGFSNGIYILSVQTEKDFLTKKIIVNH